MKKTAVIILYFTMLLTASGADAQDDSKLDIFGYFQAFYQHHEDDSDNASNSFSLQQMNIFFQRNLSQKWNAFISLEFLNSFSTSRFWGELNIDEAWISYHASRQLQIKAGLIVPTFNNMNEIKNRMPLLPYIYRPIIYEVSMVKEFPVEEFVPLTANLQVFGAIPADFGKIDWAVFLGNSPNINRNPREGQTGIDTTSTLLYGGRLGIRSGELKAGVSFSHDKVDYFREFDEFFGNYSGLGRQMTRHRLGGDLSYNIGKFSFESEFIGVEYDEKIDMVSLDKEFAYGTLGYQVTDKLFGYTTYNYMHAEVEPLFEIYMRLYYLGAAYRMSDRVVFKAQYGKIDWQDEFYIDFISRIRQKGNEDYVTLGLSVFF